MFQFHCTILALLLNSGSSVTVQDNEGITPLHHVAMYCEREQCTALLCAVRANVRRRNHGNMTAAQLARVAATKRMLRKLWKTPPRPEQFCMLVIRQRLKDQSRATPSSKGAKGQTSSQNAFKSYLSFFNFYKLHLTTKRFWFFLLCIAKNKGPEDKLSFIVWYYIKADYKE